jgi:hypothetical protein
MNVDPRLVVLEHPANGRSAGRVLRAERGETPPVRHVTYCRLGLHSRSKTQTRFSLSARSLTACLSVLAGSFLYWIHRHSD